MGKDLLEEEMFKEQPSQQKHSTRTNARVEEYIPVAETIDERMIIEWEAPEFNYYPKDRFWYTIAGLVTALGSLDAYLLGNILLATLIILGGTVIIFTAGKKPMLTPYKIDWRGVTIGETKHRYFEYESFWIAEKNNGNILLLSPSNTFGQQTVIPLGNTDLYTVQKYLLNHLPEVPDKEPLSHMVMEYLGL